MVFCWFPELVEYTGDIRISACIEPFSCSASVYSYNRTPHLQKHQFEQMTDFFISGKNNRNKIKLRYLQTASHDDVIKCKQFPPYWPFVRGIHRWPSQRPVTRSFDVIFGLRLNKRIANNRDAGDLRYHRAHYDVIVMEFYCSLHPTWCPTPMTTTKSFWCIYDKIIPGAIICSYHICRNLFKHADCSILIPVNDCIVALW